MKKKVLLIFVLTIILRIITILFVKDDPVFFLSPRNFNGRGLLAMPSWLDFIIPLIIIVFLYNKNLNLKISLKLFFKPFISSFLLIFTPVLIGILLNNYVQKSLIRFDFNLVLVLRYLLFILTFVAINFFADSLTSKKKYLKYIILTVFLISIAYTQDLFASGSSMHVLLGLLNSVGFSTVIFSVGMRKNYKEEPVASVIAISLSGIFL
ncbi:MAG: hypothetical protein GXO86_03285 [Chlorobi bacterium]|nr:hypothetical protein [Chlorobiota bacterium]